MKWLPLVLAAACSAPLAQATTVVASGGVTAPQFVTSAGTFLTPTNSTVEVGAYDVINGFTKFAPNDATPITFGTTTALTGRWLGNFADTSTDANVFGGKQVAVRVTVDLGGGGVASALFLATSNFPTNGGGVGDTLNLGSINLTTLVANMSTPGSAAYQAANATYPTGYLVVGVPETSTTLLAALGAGVLLRRRRRF